LQRLQGLFQHMSDGCHQNERRNQAGGDTISTRLSGLQLVRGVLSCGRGYNEQGEILAFDDGLGIRERPYQLDAG
jgi:hypothetical protein